ncbi:hypothetical protein Metlim_1512 [Methanoplanus limicola DSM 2279]|uniref:Uncharacterized protein n=1 Tax=Methanoplanus limicola DSM 2279 TaxID=937775 RepID=H1Z3L5_9EURY|nr:hypothetical protein Metlim_1512 [Methanoplanus limicola DSM 2279]
MPAKSLAQSKLHHNVVTHTIKSCRYTSGENRNPINITSTLKQQLTNSSLKISKHAVKYHNASGKKTFRESLLQKCWLSVNTEFSEIKGKRPKNLNSAYSDNILAIKGLKKCFRLRKFILQIRSQQALYQM